MFKRLESEDRKASWLQVKKRLQWRGYTRSELKTFERYFICGQEPEWGKGVTGDLGDATDPIPLFYRLWFSCDQSQEAWQRILESVLTTYTDVQIMDTLRETRNILYQEACSPAYCGIEGRPVGFMGGGEERLFKFLLDGSYKGERIFKAGGFGVGYYRPLLHWLEQRQYENPFTMLQYMQELWYEELSDCYMEKLLLDGAGDVVKKYLKAVSSFTPLEKGEYEYLRIEHCQKVRDILNIRPIPSLLAQWWRDTSAQSSDGSR